MDSIEPDELYDERGSVDLCRPLLQGDVFDDVLLPGFDEPMLVQVVNHPCAMRKGPELLPRITVAPVRPHQRVRGNGWNGNFTVMPLPELVAGDHFATHFADVTAAPVELLDVRKRVASLQDRGIYVLQQRLVKHYTRIDASISDLHEQSAPTLTEAELQVDWLHTVLPDDEQENIAAIDAEVVQFDAWLGAGDPSSRTLLKQEYNFSDVRRAAHQAAIARRTALHGS